MRGAAPSWPGRRDLAVKPVGQGLEPRIEDRDGRNFKQGEAVALGEEILDDLVWVPLLFCDEKFQHTPVNLSSSW